MNFVYKIHMRICIRIRESQKKICMRISELRAQIFNEERNLCTNVNKPTQLHQDRNSKISSFDNYMVSLKSKSIKIISKFSTCNCVY